ncbi:threonine aldolase [Adhaeribacter aerolatus]|uniref:Threonine aldolase n=1 Tax=Adhaeribacter aerolatus TaxID=670289 RepID=A0A512AYA8_9BACT|nr:D-TA family PLP-dependent enzyme [Adhaeribacter aerolatus]GEO04712.1 threonine aldolase [Adhaeribacter aerolatus]
MFGSEPEWFTIKNIAKIDTPALVVYPERVKENIRLLKSMVAGVEWLRPHVKTHKMAEVSQLLLAAGITKFKCATIAEAEMLGMAGAPDVLLAYQPVGPKIKRLRLLTETYPDTQYSCLIDNAHSAAEIGGIFDEAGRELPVFVDLNVGMNRTGIKPGPEALGLYLACQEIDGVKPIGLHAYDGHLRDTDFAERKRKSDVAFAPVAALAAEITGKGLPNPILVVGGSPTFPVHALRSGVECSPGTFIFWDWGYSQALPEQNFSFAALVLTRVISKPNNETLCLDLGHKSVAAENPFPRVIFLNAPDVQAISQSEEHLVVKVNPGNNYQVGDVFYGVPIHICPTCALYEQAYVAEAGEVKTTWKVVSRNRFITV